MPKVAASKLSGSENRYKIKLRNLGYRLVYDVREAEVLVLVIAVGRRDKSTVYKKAKNRS